ncbi:MAG: thioredoxin [bacterium]|jgi:thioredoxin 1
MSEIEIEVNDGNFQTEVIESKLPVLVDFFATWCGPCRTIAPTVEEIAKEHQGKIKVCKVNIDDAPDCTSRCGVLSVPTLVLFKGGVEIERLVGAVPRPSIDNLIAPYV